MAFGMLPNDPRLQTLSPAQELWMYAHLKRKDKKRKDEVYDLAKMICTFINQPMAQEYFTPPETTENLGFEADIRAMDPTFDMTKYAEFLEENKK
jgi:hypothetical protein